METYPKIQSLFKRDMEAPKHPLIEGSFSIPEFEYLQNNLWGFTEKVDGTNIRVKYYSDTDMLVFDGKNDNSQIPPTLVKTLNDLFYPKIEIFKKMFETDICLYGEGYGPGIQKGGKYRKDQSFILFDCLIDGWWLERKNLEDISNKLSIDIVPLIGKGNLDDLVEIVKRGFNSQWGKFTAEGIVAKPLAGLKRRNGERVITKLKCSDFS